ncbi:MAG: helix-turn-helix domain-containing protein, partial [Thaumarchaeota archaeon]|nr:helix-turn-helix domain-containing protein [Nitrososphaerota archaeon]
FASVRNLAFLRAHLSDTRMGWHLHARNLSSEETNKLHSMVLSKDFTKRMRASIVIESSKGLKVGEISEILHLNKHTVRLWIKRFNQNGIQGLESKPVPGRPPSITDKQKDAIMRIALTNPRDLGMNFTTWSLSSLQNYLQANRIVKKISGSWIRKILIKRGFPTSKARDGRQATIRITMPR